MRVTFDTNAWQRVVCPDKFPKDPRCGDFRKIHTALKDGAIVGFICDSVATMEGVKNKDRPRFFSTQAIEPRVIEVGDPPVQVVIAAPDQSGRLVAS